MVVGVGGEDAADDLGLLRMGGDDGGSVIMLFECPFLGVEAELGLASFFVGTVTGEAVFGQDGVDVAAEVNRRIGGERARADQRAQGK